MLMTIAEVVVVVVSSVCVCVCVCVCDNKTNQKNTVFVVCLPQGISKVWNDFIEMRSLSGNIAFEVVVLKT